MKEAILVTGGTGTIGRELIKQLRSKDICVRIAVRDPQKILEIDTSGCPVVYFDYEKPDTFYHAFENIDSLFLSAPLRCKHLDQLLLPAIQTAKLMGVDQIVTMGAIGVEQGTDTPLSIFEKCIISSGINYTILRPNLLMQNFINLAGDFIRKTGKINLPAGNSRISFVDGRDVAEAAQIALIDPEYRNHIYTLTGKESLNHYQIARILSKVTGRDITYTPVSHNEARKKLEDAGWDWETAELMIGLYEIARHGWCEEIRNDLKEILGRDPITFESFALEFRDYWIKSDTPE